MGYMHSSNTLKMHRISDFYYMQIVDKIDAHNFTQTVANNDRRERNSQLEIIFTSARIYGLNAVNSFQSNSKTIIPDANVLN